MTYTSLRSPQPHESPLRRPRPGRAGGETQTQTLRSGSSYLSASELVLTFGLAHNEKADTIEIRWPSGQIDRLSSVPAGATITVTEARGITYRREFGKWGEARSGISTVALSTSYKGKSE